MEYRDNIKLLDPSKEEEIILAKCNYLNNSNGKKLQKYGSSS